MTERRWLLRFNHLKSRRWTVRTYCFNNLAGLYRDTGRLAEAEPLYKQSIEINRIALGEQHPSYATSLNNFAAVLGKLGRRDEALDSMREALEIRRELAATRPDAFLPDLAMSLNNLAAMLSEFGRREEALEAVEHSRELAEARPGAFVRDFKSGKIKLPYSTLSSIADQAQIPLDTIFNAKAEDFFPFVRLATTALVALARLTCRHVF